MARVALDAIERVWRENRCIGNSTAAVYRQWVRRFAAYCGLRRLSERAELTRTGVADFVQWYLRSHRIKAAVAARSAGTALHCLAMARQTLGESLPPWEPPSVPACPSSPLLREFAQHLEQHRGNPVGTVRKKVKHAEAFLAFQRLRRRRLPQLCLRDIDAFVVTCRKRYARITVANMCSSLRSFVGFLCVSGRVPVDLSTSILAPIVRRGERPHRALPWEDVRRILKAVDRSTPCGRRDYVLLLMMSTYGLGAGEAIRLSLDDIDWRAATLHVVRPKTGAAFLLPLLPAVTRALVSYLRHGRPAHASTRHLFVRMMAPHEPLSAASAIRHVLNTHAQRAGVSAPYLGSHVLRHTHACRQLELGTQPKLIGDILGHRDPQSTSAYLRVSVERLRQVALAVPS